MKIKPKFCGIIKDSKFVPDWPEQRQAYLLGLEGQKVEEVIGKPQVSKTLPQLRYFHGVICSLASEASGYTKEEVKGLLKGEFLTRYVTGPTGKVIAWVPSLADLKKDEMSNFIDSCIMLCARHWGCVIPPPDTIVY